MEKKYDYIFTDMKMKRMQGDEFIHETRLLPNGDTYYFIVTGGVTTNNTNNNKSENDYRKICDAYIEKPFTEETILEVLNTVLAQAKDDSRKVS